MASNGRYGTHGCVLVVDLGTGESHVDEVPEDVYKKFLGGYGLGAYLMWKHYPTGSDPLAPESCFAIVSGLLTGVKTPFSGRIQIVAKSPLTGSWADSNSGGSVASHLRNCRLRRPASDRACRAALPAIGRCRSTTREPFAPFAIRSATSIAATSVG